VSIQVLIVNDKGLMFIKVEPKEDVLKIEGPTVAEALDAQGWPSRWSDPHYLGDGPWGA
jgi:hypothetical protein